jgi:apolipoprotein N-acyltransferase
LSQRTKTFHEAAVAEDVAWLQLGSPYRLWGNAPWWLLTALAFAMAFVKRPVSRDD